MMKKINRESAVPVVNTANYISQMKYKQKNSQQHRGNTDIFD